MAIGGLKIVDRCFAIIYNNKQLTILAKGKKIFNLLPLIVKDKMSTERNSKIYIHLLIHIKRFLPKDQSTK